MNSRLWLAAILAAAAARSERLPLRLFTSADGLASNSVNRIVRDSRGYLWFCTGEGLSRFDGSEFTTYTTDHGLPGRSVTDLLETRNGEYWAATTSGGVARFLPRAAAGAKFQAVPVAKQKGALHVNALAQTPDGAVWSATNAGLYRFERNEFRAVGLDSPSEPWADQTLESLLADREGNLWAGGSSGLWRIAADGTRARWTAAHGLPENAVISFLQEPDGKLWAGTSAGVCRILSNAKPGAQIVERCYTTRDGLPGDYAQRLLFTSRGELWVGTLEGAAVSVRGADGAIAHFDSVTVRRGLSDNNIEGLAEDIEGNIWLGSTDDGGAMRLARLGAVRFDENDGLDSPNVISILEDRSGVLRAVTRSPQGLALHRFDGQKFLPARLRMPPGKFRGGYGVQQVALQDRLGRWWISTDGALLEYGDPERNAPNKVHRIPNAPVSVFRVFEDAESNIWWSVAAPGHNALARYDRAAGVVRTFTEHDGLPPLQNMLATAFAQDRTGAVWFASLREPHLIVRYRNGRFETISQPTPGPLGIPRSAMVDSAGRLWFGTGLGLWRADHPEADKPVFVRMGMSEGLSSPSIHALAEDLQGRIYAVSGSAVDRIDLKTGKVRHYTTADGLPFGTLQTAYRDRAGALWFGSTRGIARFIVGNDDGPATPPRALVSALRVRGAPAAISDLGETSLDGLVFQPDENQLEFRFAAVSFQLGDPLRFQYRLEGAASQEWSEPAQPKSVNFANLKPGRYRLLVRTVYGQAAASSAPASVSFHIRPPFWATWWFEAGAALLAMALIYAGHSYRTRRILEVSRLRTRIATDLHDDIGSSLSRIAILSEVAARQSDGNSGLAESLARIGNVSREVVDSMSDIVWAVNPRYDSFADLAWRMRRVADDLAASQDVRLECHIADETQIHLGTMVRREVFLIFKEALNNALRHSGCEQARLEAAFDSGWISLEISDDGQGFDPATVERGNGLDSMRAKAEALGGELTIESAAGRGTTVRLRAPAGGRPR